ncbi:hypothetical protein XENOCAPTIV_006307, partial [Xenoophorus captivus]
LLTAVYFFLSSYLFSFYKLAMASKLNPNILYVAGPGESLGSPQADSERTHITGEAGEESSDSEGEQEETSHKLIRKVSTSGQIRAKTKSVSALVKELLVLISCDMTLQHH